MTLYSELRMMPGKASHRLRWLSLDRCDKFCGTGFKYINTSTFMISLREG